jgi:hypothetical protein
VRVHEITTHRSRLRRLKQLFDRIYRELALCRSGSVALKKRKPRPPTSMDDNVGRSVLSARYPTIASTARHMPQRIVAKLKRARKPKPVMRAAPAASGKRSAPRAKAPVSPPKPPTKPTAHSQQSAAKQVQAGTADGASQPTATTSKPTAIQHSTNPTLQQPVSAQPANSTVGVSGTAQTLPKPVTVPAASPATLAGAAVPPRPPFNTRAVQRVPRPR